MLKTITPCTWLGVIALTGYLLAPPTAEAAPPGAAIAPAGPCAERRIERIPVPENANTNAIPGTLRGLFLPLTVASAPIAVGLTAGQASPSTQDDLPDVSSPPPGETPPGEKETGKDAKGPARERSPFVPPGTRTPPVGARPPMLADRGKRPTFPSPPRGPAGRRPGACDAPGSACNGPASGIGPSRPAGNGQTNPFGTGTRPKR